MPEVREVLWQWHGLCIDLEQDLTCLKAALYGLASESPLLSLIEVIRYIVSSVEPPVT